MDIAGGHREEGFEPGLRTWQSGGPINQRREKSLIPGFEHSLLCFINTIIVAAGSETCFRPLQVLGFLKAPTSHGTAILIGRPSPWDDVAVEAERISLLLAGKGPWNR